MLGGIRTRIALRSLLFCLRGVTVAGGRVFVESGGVTVDRGRVFVESGGVTIDSGAVSMESGGVTTDRGGVSSIDVPIEESRNSST